MMELFTKTVTAGENEADVVVTGAVCGATRAPVHLYFRHPKSSFFMTNANFVPVVKSLLENDLYKFTMWQALFHSHPAAHAEYEFTCRNRPEYPLSELADELNVQLDYLCTLRFNEGELDYLRSLRYIKSDFVDFLSLFHLQRKFITVSATALSCSGVSMNVKTPRASAERLDNG